MPPGPRKSFLCQGISVGAKWADARDTLSTMPRKRVVLKERAEAAVIPSCVFSLFLLFFSFSSFLFCIRSLSLF